MTYEEAYNLGFKRGEERAKVDVILMLMKTRGKLVEKVQEHPELYKTIRVEANTIENIIDTIEKSMPMYDNPYHE